MCVCIFSTVKSVRLKKIADKNVLLFKEKMMIIHCNVEQRVQKNGNVSIVCKS